LLSFNHDQLFVADPDLGSRPLPEEDAVVGHDAEKDELASFIATTGTYSEDLAFLRKHSGLVCASTEQSARPISRDLLGSCGHTQTANTH